MEEDKKQQYQFEIEENQVSPNPRAHDETMAAGTDQKLAGSAGKNQVDLLKEIVNKEMRTFTRAEVATHNTKDDCWFVYKNEVYDVTKFIPLHPAGPSYLTDYAGADTSVEFDQVGHSETAYRQLEEYKIGSVSKEDVVDHEAGGVALDSGKKWVRGVKLIQKKKVSHNSTIFTFKFDEEHWDNFKMDLEPGQHISITAEIDGQQVMRPYTPIECRPESSEFDCLIKIYPNGLMSQYLDGLDIGASLNIRGVFSDLTYKDGNFCIAGFMQSLKVENISMIAGGTGIAPCYQIIKSALASKKDKTKINLIYSNTTVDDILLKDELLELQRDHSDQLKIHFTVTQDKGENSIDEAWSKRRIDQQMLSEHLEKPTVYDAKHYVLVCGPNGMAEKARELLDGLNYKYKTLLGMPNKYPEVPRNWLGRLHHYNPFIVYWFVSLFLMFVIWSYSRGEIGLGGRFCVEGFTNELGVTRYAYRLVRDPKWSLGSEAPDEGCNVDPFIGQLISWILYIPHQLAQWWILYKAQQEEPKYSTEWRWFNWWMLYVNGFFMVLKLVTNAISYNAMSSHLPLWFGQGAVFNILLMILAMQVPVRGMCCGTCSRGCKVGRKKCCNEGKIWTEMAMFLRKYHGYYMLFGVTSDWYYHPLEATPGHLTGILNDLLILWQSISMYTPAHRNKWWCIACEFCVTLHGPLIALGRGGGAGMFGFGFAIVFMCSGQWGLPLKWYERVVIFILFLTCLLCNYGLGWSARFGNEPVGWKDLNEVTRIPSMYYMIMGIYFLYYCCVRWIRNIKNDTARVGLAIFASVIATGFGFAPFVAIVGTH